MSFFDDDEDDAIEQETVRTPRVTGSAQPRGGSMRPAQRPRPRPSADPAVERRRLIAIGVLVVVVILVVLLISSCQASNTRTSLEDYNNSVSSLITRSDATGGSVFRILASGKGGSTIAQDLAGPLQSAQGELSAAENLGVPGQMAQAQSHLLLALTMRADAISTIATSVQSVSGSGSGTNQAVSRIAAAMARFYASDVIYKGYVAPEIAGALHGDSIPVGGNSNIQINPGQFLTNLGWLQENYIATKLNAHVSTASGSGSGRNADQPGIHGDAVTAVAVGSNTLASGVTNTVAGTPAPTFTISVANGGQYNEYNVGCSVSVSGGPSGHSSIPETTPNTTSTCNVTLSATVPPGTYQVTVTIAKVPGEQNVANNTATYSVQFQ